MPPRFHHRCVMSVFPPDSFIVADVAPSPNFDERKDGRPPDMILLHYTGMQTGEAALERLCHAEPAKFPAITWSSRMAALCNACPRRGAPGTPANHPGLGETDINSRSIGIEIVNPGHEFGYSDFPLRQIAAVISLCRSIITRRGPISADRILGHSDVAPARKQDPGEKFPWGLLSESGVGHWVRAAPLNLEGRGLKPGDRGDSVTRLQRTLRTYGYGLAETGTYDDATREVVTAFQRHFRQARVDGVADPSTLLTLRALIETRPAALG